MNFADLLSGFINEQILGLAFILIGIGFLMTKYFKVDKKKTPVLFLVIAMPISIFYHLFLNPELHLYVNIMNGIYQAMFSIVFSMGFYDLGKGLWQSLKYRIKKDNPRNKKEDPAVFE